MRVIVMCTPKHTHPIPTPGLHDYHGFPCKMNILSHTVLFPLNYQALGAKGTLTWNRSHLRCLMLL